MEESGDRKGNDELNASDWKFEALVLKVCEKELGMLDLIPGDLRFILRVWLPSDSAWNPRRPGSEGSHGVCPAICCRVVMKEQVCT